MFTHRTRSGAAGDRCRLRAYHCRVAVMRGTNETCFFSFDTKILKLGLFVAIVNTVHDRRANNVSKAHTYSLPSHSWTKPIYVIIYNYLQPRCCI